MACRFNRGHAGPGAGASPGIAVVHTAKGIEKIPMSGHRHDGAQGRGEGVRVVFVQPQFSEKSAQVIARQLGASVVRLDPLAADWDDNLRRAARAFVDALQ